MTALTGGSVTIQWDDTSDNETAFVVERFRGPLAGCTDTGFAALSPTVDANVTRFSDATVASGETYGYRVRARNNLGASSPSPAVQVTVPAAVNLLVNGGFETDANGDGQPDAWEASRYFTRSTAAIRSGSFAGQFHRTDDGAAYAKQIVGGIVPGASYAFSGCVSIPPTTDAFTFKLLLKWRDAAGAQLVNTTVKTYTAATAGWDCAARTSMVAPANADSVDVRLDGSSLRLTIYVDDLRLEAQ